MPQVKTSRSSQSIKKEKPLSEAHIQNTVTAWLELDGWRCIRTDMPHLRGLGVSEPGMPDNLYIRYRPGYEQYGPCGNVSRLNPALSETLWIEYKRRKGKTAQHQKDWHAKERARGAFVLSCGEDLKEGVSIESICEWYAASGLQRKKMSIPR